VIVFKDILLSFSLFIKSAAQRLFATNKDQTITGALITNSLTALGGCLPYLRRTLNFFAGHLPNLFSAAILFMHTVKHGYHYG